MSTSNVFKTNRGQAVRLPAEARFPGHVKRVDVRVVGQERIISPMGSSWDSFFLGGKTVSDDFMTERASQDQADRKAA